MPDPIVYGFPRSTFVNIVRLVLTHKDVRYTFHDLEAVRIGVGADIAIGFSNGLLGGLTGLGGVISTISCQLRGWPKDVSAPCSSRCCSWPS